MSRFRAKRASVTAQLVAWSTPCSLVRRSEGKTKYYKDLCAFDGRIVLAGEHASYIGGWQEGAVTSATDALTRLNARIQKAV